MHAFFSFHSALFEGRLICQISNHMVFSLPLSMLYILLILLIVVNLPYFQEEMMSKENPIKLQNLKKKQIKKENSMAVDRLVDRIKWAVNKPVDRTQQRRNTTQMFDMQQTLSIGSRHYRQPEAQNRIQVSFSGAFMFFLVNSEQNSNSIH